MKSPSIKFDSELIKNSSYAKFQDFHSLMRYRITDIILVSSLYDSYIFEEDSRLYELIREEYQGLNLSHSPELVQVSSGAEAIAMAKREKRFDLIITTQHIDDMPTIIFPLKVKEAGLDIPVVLLGYDNREMLDLLAHKEIGNFEKAFIWSGDYRIILGIIKYIEDKKNVEEDTKNVGVQSIILIEDNVRFYSSYLPLFYTEILKQSQRLIREGINLSHKFLRMRARPKVLLCNSYEEAWMYYKKYEEYILGIISDVDFLQNGRQDPQAGIQFVSAVRLEHEDIPILLQSNVPENEEMATAVGARFLLKDSPTLLSDLSKFINENFGFGEFLFRNNEGKEFGRAINLHDLENLLKIVPEESIVYHSSRNHFSNWLKARTEFWLAHKLRPQKVSDYPNFKALRESLIESVHDFRISRQRGIVLDFSKKTFDESSFARLGGGSLGGKARGLGFINRLLSNFEINSKFKDVEIFVPPSVVLGTDVFDYFLRENDLLSFTLHCNDDLEIIKRFLQADKFPPQVVSELRDFLELINEPLAIRSSSLLEDSQGQPFAGVYDTFMVPNNHADIEVRLHQLLMMVKHVYASTFYQKSKEYIKVTSYRLEEEKMAVIIQKVIGSKYGTTYYPEFSGVAKSYNFYPVKPLKASDGIVSVAFGLGKTITDGGNTVRFCPKYPQHLMQSTKLNDVMKYAQQDFFALELIEFDDDAIFIDDIHLKRHHISEAEKDGTLFFVASTYSQDNNAIYDGVSRPGNRLFTMAPILKYNVFPLPEILDVLLEMGSWGMGSPVEIEFAVNLNVPRGTPKEFGLLQMRPLVISNEMEELEIGNYNSDSLICKSNQVLGNGISKNIRDIVFVDIDKFERSKSGDVAHEIAQMNSKIVDGGGKYLLIGVGRWGTLDPWLGIPITWDNIGGARAIVESNFKDFNVSPSQGSHFFQNLTSFKVGYFTVNNHNDEGFINWEWLKSQPAVEEKNYIRHIKLDYPLTIKINGPQSKGVILKPGIE
ncbi:MAG: PEP/pyruvate-binding domain-containing protein [bacterium]